MEREDAIFPQYYRLQRGTWEYMEIPLPVPTERRRYVYIYIYSRLSINLSLASLSPLLHKKTNKQIDKDRAEGEKP